MKLACLLLLLAPIQFALAVTPTATSAGPARLLQAEDFAGLRDVDEPNISPDGKRIAYVVKLVDIEKDKLVGNLWMAKWDGSENRALTFDDKGAAHPRWSPDGKWIAFLSGRDDENEEDQVWVLPSDGGEAEKLTNAKGGVEDFAWAPDSKRLALVVKDPDSRKPEKKEKEKRRCYRTDAPLFKNVEMFRWRGATPGLAAWADRMEAPRLLERCEKAAS